MHKRLILGLGLSLISAGYASACPFCYDPKGLFIGETKVMGNGTVYSWIKLDDKKNPMGVGITFTATALEGLQQELPASGAIGYEIPLKLPAEAAETPFDHVAFDWNPKGHIPKGIYDVPHFDAHFFILTVDERLSINVDAEGMKKIQRQPQGVMPEGYMYAPQSEERYMGAHWVSLTTPELHGQPFTQTFIYGSYDGRMAFIEPMLTMAYLKTNPMFITDIPQPKLYPTGKYFPTKYRISFDKSRQEYTVALEGMVKR
jgi:hypothetical protein